MRIVVAVMSLLSLGTQAAKIQSWDFDDSAAGSLPNGWKVEAAGQEQATATWQVVRDVTAPRIPRHIHGRLRCSLCISRA
jgi:hypothetical protein